MKRINKINKCLHRLTNKERERTQINKKRDNNDSVEIQKIRRKYYELVYANKLDNIEEIDKFPTKPATTVLGVNKQFEQTDH